MSACVVFTAFKCERKLEQQTNSFFYNSCINRTMNPLEIYLWASLHYNESFSEEKVEKKFQKSFQEVNEVFFEYYHENLVDAWKGLRLSKAAWLLMKTTVSLNAIAKEVGYPYRELEELFIEEYRLTPYEFRMRYKDKEGSLPDLLWDENPFWG